MWNTISLQYLLFVLTICCFGSIFVNGQTTETPGNNNDSSSSSLDDWVWILIGLGGFDLVMLVVALGIYGAKRNSSKSNILPQKIISNGYNNRQAVIPVAAPLQQQQQQQLQPVRILPQQPMILPGNQKMIMPGNQQQQLVMAGNQQMIIAPQQQARQNTVMTNYGPVPLLTQIPMVRHINSQPNMRGFRTHQAPPLRPLQNEGPIVEFPDDYGRTLDRDAYSDIEQHIRLNDELDDIYGSFGRGPYEGSMRSRNRSIYGGSMRSRRSKRSRRSRHHSGSRPIPIDDVYQAGPAYSVIEHRLPPPHYHY